MTGKRLPLSSSRPGRDRRRLFLSSWVSSSTRCTGWFGPLTETPHGSSFRGTTRIVLGREGRCHFKVRPHPERARRHHDHGPRGGPRRGNKYGQVQTVTPSPTGRTSTLLRVLRAYLLTTTKRVPRGCTRDEGTSWCVSGNQGPCT